MKRLAILALLVTPLLFPGPAAADTDAQILGRRLCHTLSGPPVNSGLTYVQWKALCLQLGVVI